MNYDRERGLGEITNAELVGFYSAVLVGLSAFIGGVLLLNALGGPLLAVPGGVVAIAGLVWLGLR